MASYDTEVTHESIGSRVTQVMKTPEHLEKFSLAGGPLHRLGCRLGLVRGGTDSVALGLALGLVLWGVLVALAFIDEAAG